MTSASTPSSGILADASLNLTATAVGTWDPAKADALIPTRVVGYNPASTSVQGSGVLIGTATANLEASAQTKGDDPATDYAIASIASTLNSGVGTGALPMSGFITKGMDLSAGDTTVGNASQILGQADLNAVADASAIEGLAVASGESEQTVGIDLGTSTLTSGSNASINAVADSALEAKASAVEGNASAVIFPGSVVSGFGIGDGTANIGADATIRAYANNLTVVDASTTQGSGTGDFSAASSSNFAATALANEGLVKGLDINQLSAGDNLSLEALAKTSLQANAFSVDTGSGQEGSLASLTDYRTIGTDSTEIDTGGDLQKFTSTANTFIDASSKSIGGNSKSTGGNIATHGSIDSNITVGGNADSGLAFAANTNIDLNASSVKGFSDASAVATSTALNADSIVPSISIGGDSGLISAIATTTLSGTASSVTPLGEPPLAQSYAELINEATYGVNSVSVGIGRSGKIAGTGSVSIDAYASNIGVTDLSNPRSSAFSYSKAQVGGIRFGDNLDNSIQIGHQGAVSGQSFLQAQTRASNISGLGSVPSKGTEAESVLNSTGINLQDVDNVISIGAIGSIDAISVFGGTSASSLTPVIIESRTIKGASKSSLDPLSSSRGIEGPGFPASPATLIAGPTSGNISGKSLVSVDISSEAVDSDGESISSDYFGFSSYGIKNTNLAAGRQNNSNIIHGESNVNFLSQSTSVNGNAFINGGNATNPILSSGIFGHPALTTSASLSGNLTAQSNLVNTSLAQTVTGSATSNLHNISLGISHYEVDINDSGSFMSSASSHGRSRALSVSGSSSA